MKKFILRGDERIEGGVPKDIQVGNMLVYREGTEERAGRVVNVDFGFVVTSERMGANPEVKCVGVEKRRYRIINEEGLSFEGAQKVRSGARVYASLLEQLEKVERAGEQRK